MCTTAYNPVSGITIETIGDLRKIATLIMKLHEPDDNLLDDQCLCPVDVLKTLISAGFKVWANPEMIPEYLFEPIERDEPPPTSKVEAVDSYELGLERAADLVEANAIQDTSSGKKLVPRQEGNRDGLHYAIAIRELAIEPSPAPVSKVETLDWSNFDGPKRNAEWKPDDQDLIYTAINFRDDEWGDADEDAGQQIVERLLAAWKATADGIEQASRQLVEGGELLLEAETVIAEMTELCRSAKDVIASASDTYKKRNGHKGSFEDDSGEKCWIVPFDAFESLRSAVAALSTAKGKGQ